jgi:phytoene dehydrogenase-like protein
MTRDAIIVGGGVNGLVCASLLARAGRRVLVVEQSDRLGGCLRTDEIVPGFRGPTLTHAAAIDPAIARSLALERHGLAIHEPAADACAPTLDGRALVLWRNPARAAESIRSFSTADAQAYPAFLERFARMSGVIRAVLAAPPPSIDDPHAADLIDALKAGRRFRGLGRPDAYELLRWIPAPVADVIADTFESEPLRATVAAGGLLGAFLGPRSAGSAAALLWIGATEGRPIPGGYVARGGPGAVADALAASARAASVEFRIGDEVRQIEVGENGATGVTLASGETLVARVVVSNADPRRTFSLVDPAYLEPEFIRRVQNIRAQGTLAKVNYAVSALPRFVGVDGDALSGRIRLAARLDTMERAFDAAKYGALAAEPWIELTIPSVGDPSLAAGAGHVVSAYVQYAPYRLRDSSWDIQRDRLGDVATQLIEQYSPGFASTVVGRQVITPLDLERKYGLTGGHIFHAELALDQFFVARPTLGWARYRTPIANLFLCGAGTHPGAGATGRSGALAAKEILKTR